MCSITIIHNRLNKCLSKKPHWLSFMALLILIPSSTSTMINRINTCSPFPFIKFESNRISPASKKLKSDYLAKYIELAKKGDTVLKIVHIGDSHIQADIFTGNVRRLLCQYFGEEHYSRGFCFPFSITGSNNPKDLIIRAKGQWASIRSRNMEADIYAGIAGTAIETADPEATIQLLIKNQDSIQTLFDQIRIHYEGDIESFTPLVDQDFYATSKESNAIRYRSDHLSNSITISFRKENDDQKRFLLYGIELINSKSKIIYHAAGINGADVKSYLSYNRIKDQLINIKPQLIVVSLGTNDSYNQQFDSTSFGESLERLVESIQTYSPDAVIVLTTPGDHLINRREINPNLEPTCTQIKLVAEKTGCFVWDFNTIMGGTGSIHNWRKNGLCSADYVHLNTQGYTLQGNLFFNALVDLFERENL